VISIRTHETATIFACTESCRSVLVTSRQVVVSDTESITEFKTNRMDPNVMTAINRIAIYLTPNPNSREGVAWQQVGGKAVAFLDYELDMNRNLEVFVNREDPQSQIYRPCVLTPRGFVQCE
jgi:hypothetical protein